MGPCGLAGGARVGGRDAGAREQQGWIIAPRQPGDGGQRGRASSAPLPAPARPPAGRQLTGRPAAAAYRWRLFASPGQPFTECRSQSTTPRRGTSSPPASPLLSDSRSAATLARSRWSPRSGGEEEKGGALNGGGWFCAGSGRGARVLNLWTIIK